MQVCDSRNLLTATTPREERLVKKAACRYYVLRWDAEFAAALKNDSTVVAVELTKTVGRKLDAQLLLNRP